jgi:hypothetical protein
LQFLIALNDIEQATNFLLDININDWITVDAVKDTLRKMSELFKTDITNISVVSSVVLFDQFLPEKLEYAVFDEEEYEEAQKIRRAIQQGLQQKYFYHILIIGNEESTQSHGHYFACAIVKVGQTIQYLVLDTLPNVYHLQKESHELNRLRYMIDQLETGRSEVDFANIRGINYKRYL